MRQKAKELITGMVQEVTGRQSTGKVVAKEDHNALLNRPKTISPNIDEEDLIDTTKSTKGAWSLRDQILIVKREG